MSGSWETSDASKYDKGRTPTSDQGKGGKAMNAGNRMGKYISRRIELVQINTTHRYFKVDTA